MNIKYLAIQGALWNIGSGFFSLVVRMGASVFLARLLDPDDFGIMALCVVVITFIGLLSDMGISSAIIAKKDLNEYDLNFSFLLLFGIRFLFFSLTFFFAPVIAEYFNEYRLVNPLRVVSFAYLLSGISAVSIALLTKNLKIKVRNLVGMLCVLVESVVAVCLAFLGLKYWSLVVALLVSSFIQNTFFLFYVKWYPKISFLFSFVHLSSIELSFSYFKKYILACLPSCFVVYFILNIDKLLIGRLLGATALGYYNFSIKIPLMYLERFAQPLTSVLFPALANLGKSGVHNMSVAVMRVLEVICLVLAPVAFFVAFFSQDIVGLLWGDKWLFISLYVSLFSIAYFFRSIAAINVPVFFAIERPDLNLKMNLSTLFLLLVFVVPLSIKFGLFGAVLGVCAGFVSPILWSFYVIKILEINFRSVFYLVFKFVFISLCASLFSKFISSFLQINPNIFWSFILKGFVFSFLYILLVFTLARNECLNNIRLLKNYLFSRN